MPLSLSMIDSAVRITSAGDLLGTGFLVTVPSETLPGVRWGYVVTAHHVIDEQIEIAVQVPDPFTNGGVLYDPVRVEAWRQPLRNVDLALAPFSSRPGSRHQAFELELMLPTRNVASPPLGGASTT